MNLTSALDRLLDPLLSVLTPEVAEKVVQLRADDLLQARLDELAVKANEGQLTAEEEREYDAYLRGLTVVSVFQTKARAFLRQRAAG
jgi:hypothetical protein